MAQPKDPYHVRPFPQQPHRGGKELNTILDELEKALGSDLPNLELLGPLQERLHTTANHFNDDKLVNLLRTVSASIDAMRSHPSSETAKEIALNVLKVRVLLKHL